MLFCCVVKRDSDAYTPRTVVRRANIWDNCHAFFFFFILLSRAFLPKRSRAYNHIPRSGSTVPLCGKNRNLNKRYTHLLTLLAWCYALHTTNSLRERFGQSNDALKGMLGTVNSTAWAHRSELFPQGSPMLSVRIFVLFHQFQAFTRFR